MFPATSGVSPMPLTKEAEPASVVAYRKQHDAVPDPEIDARLRRLAVPHGVRQPLLDGAVQGPVQIRRKKARQVPEIEVDVYARDGAEDRNDLMDGKGVVGLARAFVPELAERRPSF